MQVEYQLIDNDDKFNAVLEEFELHKPDKIAVDTEFIPERTYFPELCLVQISAFDKIFILDPKSIDIRPIKPYFETAKILFHAGAHDLLLLEKLFEIKIDNIFDTQIAASLVTNLGRRSYGDLCKLYLNRKISKSETLSKWADRPLSEKQLEYAATDVLYLFPLVEKISEELEKLDRMSWANEEFEKIRNHAKNFSDNDDSFLKIHKIRTLRNSEISIAREIYRWRENKAIASNQPPRRILNDNAIYILARSKPKDLADLLNLRGLSKKFVDADGAEIIEAVQAGLKAKVEEIPRRNDDYSLKGDEKLSYEFLVLVIKVITMKHQISDILINENHFYKKLVKAKTRKRQEEIINDLIGWRHDFLKGYLTAFIDRRIILKNASNGLPIDVEIIPSEN